MRELRGLVFLARLTCRRQAFSRKSWVALTLIALSCLAAGAWGWRQRASGEWRRGPPAPAWVQRWRPDRVVVDGLYLALKVPDAVNAADRDYHPNFPLRFAELFGMQLHLSFVLPMLCLLYAAGAWADERDERTLALLLARPLTPWKMHLAKAAGIAPVALAAGVGGFGLVCLAAGPAGRANWVAFAPAVAWTTLGYSSLFLGFGAALRRPLVFGAAYAGFFEFLVGNFPGTIKRLSIAFYGKCLMYDAGAPLGFQPSNRAMFLPVTASAARWTLALAALAFLALGAWLFHRREHHDLS